MRATQTERGIVESSSVLPCAELGRVSSDFVCVAGIYPFYSLTEPPVARDVNCVCAGKSIFDVQLFPAHLNFYFIILRPQPQRSALYTQDRAAKVPMLAGSYAGRTRNPRCPEAGSTASLTGATAARRHNEHGNDAGREPLTARLSHCAPLPPPPFSTNTMHRKRHPWWCSPHRIRRL